MSSAAPDIGIINSDYMPMLDVNKIRNDFPILHQNVNDCPLVYLDNAATTQKPISVINTISQYYNHENANVHRGVHYLSEKATQRYELTRTTVKQFINAKSTSEIIFVRGTTEAINLVSQTYGKQNIKTGDEIIISTMEHHSNIVPWQLLCEQTGAVLKIIPINDQGELDLNSYEKLLSPRTKLVAIVHISNALGTINPVKKIIELAHAAGAPILIDGAQAVAHMAIDVQELDCDFYAFSSHKLFGPTGIGILYGKESLLEKMPPYQGGGEMIRSVSFDKTTYAELPYKFEAGTPNIAATIGFNAAIEYINQYDFVNIQLHEKSLLQHAHTLGNNLPGLRIIGTAKEKASIFSFTLDNIHPHDLSTILDQQGIAIRAGHHCAMPVMERMKVPATARASFSFYNTLEEVDTLFDGLNEALRLWA